MKTVMIRRKQLHGNLNTLVEVQVLSEHGDDLRVMFPGSSRPVTIKASEAVRPKGNLTVTRSGMQHSILVPKAYPGRDSIGALIERRGF